MFILPLMAILLGIEFYLVFERTTTSYEKGLKEGYSMLVVSEKPLPLESFKALNPHIETVKALKREGIVSEIAKMSDPKSQEEILKRLPYFYNVYLDAYLKVSDLASIQHDLESDRRIKRVETFGTSYGSSYRLFSFIQFTLKLFIIFMGVVSLFLIVKQMEIWKYAHKERMQVMEIFGAPLMLRSGVLFRVAIIDAIIATLFTSALFLYVKFHWAKNSGIDMMVNHQDELFKLDDMGMLLGASLFIVIVAVYWVVFSSRGVEE
jgi:cell division transport system permease protein